MTINRLYSAIIALIIATTVTFADNGINSPYSRHGLGILADQNLGVNRQMGGLGYALRSHSYINLLNPASFSEADSITMLFEGGFSMQNINFSEGNVKKNFKNASLDYIAAQFRAFKGVGISIGYLPYSNVGYSFTTGNNESGITSTSNYNGEGGVYQPYIGIGWSPMKNLSVGLMASYIYGNITHVANKDFSDISIHDYTRRSEIKIRSYKIDLGAQYTAQFTDKQSLTLGVTYSLGHDLNADGEEIITTSKSDTTSISGGFKLPHTFGIGVLYDYNSNWKFGIDYTYQGWGSSSFFGYDKGVNRSKVSVGAEYSPNQLSRNIFKRMNYRMGAFYAQPYNEVNGQEGCEEYGASVGVTIPIVNRVNNRSLLHISGQVIRMRPKSDGMIAETYLRLNVGITFNESWFMKLKLR